MCGTEEGVIKGEGGDVKNKIYDRPDTSLPAPSQPVFPFV